jgi:hypothetical protein
MLSIPQEPLAVRVGGASECGVFFRVSCHSSTGSSHPGRLLPPNVHSTTTSCSKYDGQ